MNKRKILFTLLALALTVGSVWAQGSSETTGPDGMENIELRILWWGPQERNEKTMDALKLYEEQHPNVTVDAEYLGFDSYTDKLVTQVAAGAAPDVIQIPYQLLPEYVARNTVHPLDEYIPDIIDLSTYADSALANVKFDGKIYGAPTGISAATIYYDIDKFAELGIDVPDSTDWTWNDFRALAQEISDKTPEGYYGTFDAGGYRGAFDAFVRGRGNMWFTDDGKLGFTKQDLRDWLTMWAEMRESGAAVPEDIQSTWQQRIDMHMIVQGYAAMDFEYASVTFQPLVKQPIGLMFLPQGEKAFGSSIESVNPWIISNDSEHPEEAAKLIQFLINDTDAAAILEHSRGIPPSSAFRDKLRPTASDHDQRRYEFFDTIGKLGSGGLSTVPTGGSEVQQRLLTETNEQVAFGQLSIDEATDRFFSEAQRILGY
jgi:multiple sugar transport system substrate-binding protein